MIVTVLGSGGGTGIPNPFCQCATCEIARRSGGRDRRNAPAVLINDDLLIDCGPDVINSARQLGLSLAALQVLVITHRHSDHLDPWFFRSRRGVKDTELPLLTVYGPRDALDSVFDFYGRMFGWNRLMLEQETRTVWHAVESGSHKLIGRYRLQFVPAAHGDATLQTLLPVVHDAGAGYFHCYDSGPLPEETWTLLSGERFDVVTIDATIGLQDDFSNAGHMTAVQTIETARRLRETGLLTPDGYAVATHFVHQDSGSHAEKVAYYEPYGLTVAFDGLQLTPGGLAGETPRFPEPVDDWEAGDPLEWASGDGQQGDGDDYD